MPSSINLQHPLKQLSALPSNYITRAIHFYSDKSRLSIPYLKCLETKVFHFQVFLDLRKVLYT
jgi:hypothetical protein